MYCFATVHITDGWTDRRQYDANSMSGMQYKRLKADEYSMAHAAKTGNNKEIENKQL